MAATKKTTTRKATTRTGGKPPAKRGRGGTKGKGTRDGSKRKAVITDPSQVAGLGEFARTALERSIGVGRPRYYQNVQEMIDGITGYFQFCEENKKHPTIMELAITLGFTSKESLYNYEQYGEEFHSVIKTARTLVESIYERRASEGFNAAGPIFVLKNLGWADRKEITGAGGGPISSTNLTVHGTMDMTETERVARLGTLLTRARQRRGGDDDGHTGEGRIIDGHAERAGGTDAGGTGGDDT